MTPVDIELLQRAATAAGYAYRQDLAYDDGLVIDDGVVWNPLKNADHAIVLAAETRIFTLYHRRFHQIYVNLLEQGFELANALQRAIVETAGELPERSAWIR